MIAPAQFDEASSEMSSFFAAYSGGLVADALAMPVHWYYDREALRRDYGLVEHFMAPHNPHADSFMGKASYKPLNAKGDILHEQAQYWGKPGIHYHQFLKPGENTLNYKLAAELHNFVRERGAYDPDAWLDRYVSRMLEAHWHNDTYVEGYHRNFFTNYAQGKPARECGVDDKDIGGLASVAGLIAALEGAPLESVRAIVQTHVNLTHKNADVLRAADTFTRLLFATARGKTVREAIASEAKDWLTADEAEMLMQQPDDEVVGKRFSPACPILGSMPASLYLAWKYQGNFLGGVTANAMVGGDNCHRAVVVGGLLGS